MKRKKVSDLKMMKKAARDRQIAEDLEFGKKRAKSWGGKDSNRKSRRDWNQDKNME